MGDIDKDAGESEKERRGAAIDRILNDPRYELDIDWDEAKKLIGRWVDKEPDP